MAIAQNPASTEYDGMPRSAINTGLVDYVLPPAEMPAQLIAYVAHSFGTLHRPSPAPGATVEESLKTIFQLLRARTGHDFSLYKPNTITRCVERRMAVHRIGHVDEYARYLEQTQGEVATLFRHLLIGVTVSSAIGRHSKRWSNRSSRGFVTASPMAHRFASGYRVAPAARKPIPLPSCCRSDWRL